VLVVARVSFLRERRHLVCKKGKISRESLVCGAVPGHTAGGIGGHHAYLEKVGAK